MTQAYCALHHDGGMVVKYQVVSWISRGSTTPKPTISFNSSSEMPVCRQNSVIVKVTVTLAIMLSPNLYVDQKTTGRLPVAATARQCFHPVSAASRFSVPHTDRRSVFAHQTFAFNAQSLPGLAAWRDSQQNAFFQCWNGDFSTQRRFPRANRHYNFQIMADNIEQRMWRNMNHQPQIAIWTAVFARRPWPSDGCVDHCRRPPGS